MLKQGSPNYRFVSYPPSDFDRLSHRVSGSFIMQKSLNVKPAMTGTLFKIILNYNIKYYYIINLANFTALNYFDMAYADCIEQQGTVEGISGNKVLVRIRQISGCGQCHAKGMCSVTEMKDKIIEAYHSSPDLSEGDTVFVGIVKLYFPHFTTVSLDKQYPVSTFRTVNGSGGSIF